MRRNTPPQGILFCLLTLAVLAFGADRASADFRSFEPRCFIVFSTSPFTPSDFTSTYAVPAQDKTSVGSGTETESQGWNFDATTEENLVCSFIVPPDYDSSSSYVPTLSVSGWGITNEVCEFSPGSRTVILGVSARAYTTSQTANASWNTEDTTTLTLPCLTSGCGGGIDCNMGNINYQSYAEAAPNAQDWSPGELVFLKIRRAVASDTYGYDFHLSSVLLKYNSAY